MVGWFIGLMAPVFLHIFVTELAAAALGNVLDASSRVLLVSILVAPVAAYLYLNGGGKGSGTSADGTKPGKQGRKIPPAKRIFACALCFAAGGLLNFGWSGLLTMLGIQQHFSNAAQEALLSGKLPVQILAMGIFAPLTEELIFRGLVYRRMKEMFSVGMSVLLSSLLFAVYHGNMIQMVFAFPMAVVLAVLYEKGGGLRYPFFFHMGCNLTAVLVNLF